MTTSLDCMLAICLGLALGGGCGNRFVVGMNTGTAGGGGATAGSAGRGASGL